MKQNNIFKKTQRFLLRGKEVSKERGVGYVVREGAKMPFLWLEFLFQYCFFKLFKSQNTFEFQGNTYKYFAHLYGITYRNERTVEVPIIYRIMNKYRGKKILEVGNVLSHYFPVKYDILDKYEKADGVINQDVVDYSPAKKYDLIISISTLEHVGWDEKPRDPTKILRAIQNLKSILKPKGEIVITLPLGYNAEMDKLLKRGRIKFTKHIT